MMEIKWLKHNGKSFLDLVEILNETKNQAIFPTRFVSSLLCGYWDFYYDKIFYTQFLPFVFYMASTVSFMLYALNVTSE